MGTTCTSSRPPGPRAALPPTAGSYGHRPAPNRRSSPSAENGSPAPSSTSATSTGHLHLHRAARGAQIRPAPAASPLAGAHLRRRAIAAPPRRRSSPPAAAAWSPSPRRRGRRPPPAPLLAGARATAALAADPVRPNQIRPCSSSPAILRRRPAATSPEKPPALSLTSEP